jgi:hypothetical protein
MDGISISAKNCQHELYNIVYFNALRFHQDNNHYLNVTSR